MATVYDKRNWKRVLGAAFFAATLATIGVAQPPQRAPEGWPCIQSYVPNISPGRFWPGELPGDNRWRDDQRITLLADELVSRANSLEQSLDKVREFFATPGNATQTTAELLIGALTEAVNRERGKVLEGIDRFGKRQRMMVERIESQAQKIEKLQDAGDADAAELEDLQTRQKWDIRVFEERERMAGHLCEQPVLLEQKFFAIGRAVAALLDQGG